MAHLKGARPFIWFPGCAFKKCPVCNEDYHEAHQRLLYLPCDHLFHQSCLSDRSSCPTCSRNLDDLIEELKFSDPKNPYHLSMRKMLRHTVDSLSDEISIETRQFAQDLLDRFVQEDIRLPDVITLADIGGVVSFEYQIVKSDEDVGFYLEFTDKKWRIMKLFQTENLDQFVDIESVDQIVGEVKLKSVAIPSDPIEGAVKIIGQGGLVGLAVEGNCVRGWESDEW